MAEVVKDINQSQDKQIDRGVVNATDSTNAINSTIVPAINPSESLNQKKHNRFESKGYGSAGSRTKAQTKRARTAAKTLLESFDSSAIICYTDGSCKGNPGPCGSGATISVPLETKTSALSKNSTASSASIKKERRVALGDGTNNIAELYAIVLAFDLIEDTVKPTNKESESVEAVLGGVSSSSSSLPCFSDRSIEILSDSQYAIGSLTRGWQPKKNIDLIRYAKARLYALSNRFSKVRLHWVAGHAGTLGNERVDALADSAVSDSVLKQCLVDFKEQLLLVTYSNDTDSALIISDPLRPYEDGRGRAINKNSTIAADVKETKTSEKPKTPKKHNKAQKVVGRKRKFVESLSDSKQTTPGVKRTRKNTDSKLSKTADASASSATAVSSTTAIHA